MDDLPERIWATLHVGQGGNFLGTCWLQGRERETEYLRADHVAVLLAEERRKALADAYQAAHDATTHPSAYACREAIRALSDAPAREPFQARVKPWMDACFGPEISADRIERGDRLLEEVFELLQSGGYPRERVAQLSSYVWSRPAGDPPQEVGGVMVTLAAYCLAHGIDMHEAGEVELARIWTKVEKIRAKQAAKPTGSALPQAWPQESPAREQHPDDAAVDRFAEAMKAKLSKKREDGRGGWQDKDECPQEFLSDLLRGHVEKGDPVDVANFAMMLHQRGEEILPSAREATVRKADVECVAEAIWFDGYGKHRKKNDQPHKWPDDVLGGSQEIFRGMARAALRTLSQGGEG